MNIDRITLQHIRLPLVQPFVTSMGREDAVEHIIIRVDAEGLSGWGECVAESHPYYSPETVQTAWHILKDFMIPRILKTELPSVEAFSTAVSHIRGHRMARAGLEAALRDLYAKAENCSLASTLYRALPGAGSSPERVEVGVSIGIQESPEALVKKVETYLQEGYRRVKIKIAPGRDVKDVETLRRAFPDLRLQVDANSAYTLSDMALLKALDDFELLLIEQPLGHEDIYQHSLLQRELRTPLCLDESIHSAADAEAALALDACRIINIKPGRVGGLGESLKIHDLCVSRGIPIWHGGMLESGIGRAANLALASLPGFTLPGDISASARYFREDIVEPEFVLNPDGSMDVPTGPGIGVRVREDVLKRVTVDLLSVSA